jgi:hypothetical protein
MPLVNARAMRIAPTGFSKWYTRPKHKTISKVPSTETSKSNTSAQRNSKRSREVPKWSRTSSARLIDFARISIPIVREAPHSNNRCENQPSLQARSSTVAFGPAVDSAARTGASISSSLVLWMSGNSGPWTGVTMSSLTPMRTSTVATAPPPPSGRVLPSVLRLRQYFVALCQAYSRQLHPFCSK